MSQQFIKENEEIVGEGLKAEEKETTWIICARPGAKLWKATNQGGVEIVQHYKVKNKREFIFILNTLSKHTKKL